MNEIDLTLQQFDEMLDKYESDAEIPNSKENNEVFKNKNKISPSFVYHLVHNSNNLNDNTLKRKNALVAFEFKKIISTANHHNEAGVEQARGPSQNKSLIHPKQGLSTDFCDTMFEKRGEKNNFDSKMPKTLLTISLYGEKN
jgi:hypothetical protein